MTDQLDTLLSEQRRFPPAAAFAAQANATAALYEAAARDREGFWAEQARALEWMRPWDRVLDWKLPHAKWFVGGQLNVAANCLDRHLAGPLRNKAAIIWEGEPGDRRVLTYWDLAREVRRSANALKRLGVQKGDRVGIYLPMVPEAAIAMLACARIGAVHSVVFGGFSAESVRDRINDAQAEVLITADGGYRRGQVVPLKRMADQAMAEAPSIEHCIVVRRRPGGEGDEAFATMKEGRDHWWHRLLERRLERVGARADGCRGPALHPLHVRHDREAEGHRPHDRRLSDPRGGHHEARLRPQADRRVLVHRRHRLGDRAFLRRLRAARQRRHGAHVRGRARLARAGPVLALIETYGVTILYTAPTAIRAFMKWGAEHPAKHDLSTLRLLGTWESRSIPKRGCGTRAHRRRPLPHRRHLVADRDRRHHDHPAARRGHHQARLGDHDAFPGIVAELVDNNGKMLAQGGGFLTIAEPWPGMLRTIYGDDQRYQETYWSRFPGRYFTGDGAKLDEDGYWWILGRVDDVLNVAGHRIGTMEVESALVDHPAVAEAAVVGETHELKGQALAAFVTLKDSHQASDGLKDDLKAHVTKKIGAIARPDEIYLLGRPPQDPQREDHAAAAQGHRGGTGAGRHDDAGGSGGGEQAEGPVRGGGDVRVILFQP